MRPLKMQCVRFVRYEKSCVFLWTDTRQVANAAKYNLVGTRHGKDTTAYREGNHDNLLPWTQSNLLGHHSK